MSVWNLHCKKLCGRFTVDSMTNCVTTKFWCNITSPYVVGMHDIWNICHIIFCCNSTEGAYLRISTITFYSVRSNWVYHKAPISPLTYIDFFLRNRLVITFWANRNVWKRWSNYLGQWGNWGKVWNWKPCLLEVSNC